MLCCVIFVAKMPLALINIGGMMRRNHKIPLMATCLGISFAFLFTYLTFIPAQTSAADIVDPNEHRSLTDIDTMQEMTQQICINSRENETKQLEDTRESGKEYWVTKLRDGNCWMTQNLDYNVTGMNSTAPSAWNETLSYSAYYDPGNYYYDGPADFDGVDQHYHVGNYYTHALAVDDGKHICPYDWTLPTISGETSFAELLNRYGWENNQSSPAGINGGRGIYGDPLFFSYAGYIRQGRVNSAGTRGEYWTASGTGNSSYFLSFDTSVDPSGWASAYRGMSVRCLFFGGWLDNYDLKNDQANVAIRVSPVLNLEVMESAEDMEVDFNSVDTRDILVNVSANEKYRITLSTEQPNLLPDDKEKNADYSIKMVGENGGIVEKSKNGWGIKKKLSALSDTNLGSLDNDTVYSAVGINDEQVTFYQSSGPESLTETSERGQLKLEVGVSVDPSLPLDTYRTMVTVTASAY